MIVTWVTTIITFLIGYYLGVVSVSAEKKEQIQQAKGRIIRKVKGQKIGAVEPLSVTEMEKIGTKIEETERAMEEDLDKIL